MKKCSQCRIGKPLDCFHKNKAQKDGHHNLCKDCRRIEAVKHYYSNKDEINATVRENYRKNRRHKLYMNAKWRQENMDKYTKSRKQWEQENKEHRLEQGRRRRLRPQVQIAHRMGAQLRYSLKKGVKNGRAWETLVGYSKKKLMDRLNATMPDGYTWDDFMNGALHIDHIIPISAFNFKKPEDIDFKKCWSLSNLQLLPAKENLMKHNKLDKPFQPSFAFGGFL